MSIYFECRDFNECGWMGRETDGGSCPVCHGPVSKTMEAQELEHDHDVYEDEEDFDEDG